jgi:hypothetical protein
VVRRRRLAHATLILRNSPAGPVATADYERTSIEALLTSHIAEHFWKLVSGVTLCRTVRHYSTTRFLEEIKVSGHSCDSGDSEKPLDRGSTCSTRPACPEGCRGRAKRGELCQGPISTARQHVLCVCVASWRLARLDPHELAGDSFQGISTSGQGERQMKRLGMRIFRVHEALNRAGVAHPAVLLETRSQVFEMLLVMLAGALNNSR